MKKNLFKPLSAIKKMNIRLSPYFFLAFVAALLDHSLAQSEAVSSTVQGDLLFKSARVSDEISQTVTSLFPVSGTYKLGEVNLEQWPINVGEINYEMNSEKLNVSVDNSNIYIHLTNPSVHLEVPEMKIQTQINENLNGATLHLNINTTCSAIALDVTASSLDAPAYLFNDENSNSLKLKAVIRNFNTNDLKIKINSFNCTNISGIEKYISEQILTEFAKLDWYKAILLSKLNAKVNEITDNMSAQINEVINQQVSKLNLGNTLKSKLIKFDEKYFYFKFSLDGDLNSESVSLPQALTESSESIILSMNVSDFKKKMFEIIQNKIADQYFSSKSISSIDKLTKSRFKQFFVFPALMSRPKGTELLFKPYVESINYTIASDKIVNEICINSTSGLWTYESRQPMVYFRAQLKGSIKTENNSSVITSKLDKVESSYIWSNAYLKKYKVNEYIANSILDSSLKSMFNSNWVKENFNIFEVSDKYKFYIKDLFLESSSQKIYFRVDQLK